MSNEEGSLHSTLTEEFHAIIDSKSFPDLGQPLRGSRYKRTGEDGGAALRAVFQKSSRTRIVLAEEGIHAEEWGPSSVLFVKQHEAGYRTSCMTQRREQFAGMIRRHAQQQMT